MLRPVYIYIFNKMYYGIKIVFTDTIITTKKVNNLFQLTEIVNSIIRL